MEKKERWVVDPNGHIVKLAPGCLLKAGWRDATEADMEAAALIEAKRARAEDKAAKEAALKVQSDQLAREKAAGGGGGPLKSD